MRSLSLTELGEEELLKLASEERESNLPQPAPVTYEASLTTGLPEHT